MVKRSLIGYDTMSWLPDFAEHTKVRSENSLGVINKYGLKTMFDYGQNEFVYDEFTESDLTFKLNVIERHNKEQTLDCYTLIIGEYDNVIVDYLQPDTLYTYFIHGNKSIIFEDPKRRIAIFKDILDSGMRNSYLMLSCLLKPLKTQKFKLFSLETGEEVSYDWKYYDK
jgi:hypothetical protein